MSYKIRVKTIDDNKLTFTRVANYKIENGLIFFIDNLTNKERIFTINNIEIESEQEGANCQKNQ